MEREMIATSGDFTLYRFRDGEETRYEVEEHGRVIATDEERDELQHYVGVYFGAMMEIHLAAGAFDY